MTIAFEEVTTEELPRDSIPTGLVDVEYPCEVCGEESGPYAGRGRKPTKCEKHRTKKASASGPRVKGNTSNLAGQAAEVLIQLNRMAGLAVAAFGMMGTANAIRIAEDGFREQAHEALVTDPDLCKWLLRGGGKSAKLSLVIAYGMLGTAIAPVAISEIREIKARRDAEKNDEGGE